LGCLIVVVGAYLISLDAKAKDEEKKKNDPAIHQHQIANKKNEEFFLISMVKAIWNFKAGLYMMGTGLAWYYRKNI